MENCSPEYVLILAAYCDKAIIHHNLEEAKRLMQHAEALQFEEKPILQATIYYCIGNLISAFQNQIFETKEKATEKTLYYYRKGITEIDQVEYNPDNEENISLLKSLLLTNYANTLAYCGRTIMALEQYQNALDELPNFGMALGNLGRTYQQYGVLEYDDGHQDFLHHYAYQYFQKAIESSDAYMTSDALAAFERAVNLYPAEYIEQVLKPTREIPKYEYSEPEEATYRTWCLANRLFLNSMNDLPIFSLYFANDVLQLPPMMVDQYETPVFHGMFAALKQEYIYARFLYYEAEEPGAAPLYADCETFISAYTDYASYSIRLEKLKTAFKTLYGLFDKIAFFLAHYFDMGFERPSDIDAKSIWKTHIGPARKGYDLSHPLPYRSNFGLSALYWICKDFFILDHQNGSPNPDLQRIAEIRNYLEHRYVKIYESNLCGSINEIKDELAEYISEDELRQMTMTLLKILREALINLAFSINIAEEPKREAAKGHTIIPLELMEYDDDWKI